MPTRSRHSTTPRLRVAGLRLVATFVVTSLLAAGIVATDLFSASAAGTPITGTVFRDFNSNGQKDTAGGVGVAVDVGLAGVTVTAFDRTNTAVGTTATGTNGDYSLTVTGEASSSLRVEFTGLPAGYKSSFHGTGSTGTQGASSVQFVQAGATNVNFSVNAPEDYSQSNPPIITAIQRAGLASTPTLANQAAIVAYPWTAGFSTATGQGTTFPNATTLAKTPQVGSIWGTAFQGKTNSLYAAATYKRHSGLGPGGIAQIYRITGVLDSSGAITTGTPTVSQWLNLQGKAIVGGGTVDLGTAATDAARGIGTPTSPATDLDAYQKAGKIGIGAMAISADQNTLYFVNLNDRNLYSIDISDPVAAATSPVIKRYTLGLAAGQRPWAVEINRGYIYVGYVDSGESFTTPASATTASMSAHIIRAAETTPTVWSADLLNLNLGYTRGMPANGGNAVVTTYMTRWNTWTDLWNWTGGSVATTWFGGGPIHVFPQPILSNIQFDNQGFVSLAFLDRASLQGGNRNHSTVAGDNTTYESLSNGDLLMASQAANGVMTTENNAVVGTRTGSGSASQAPGGKEFYNDQQALGTGTIHQEISLGGLTSMGGVSEVVASVYDPLAEIRVAGTNWFSTTNGAVLRGYNLTPDAGGSANTDGTFQKGGGLGDIEALSDDAPLEIGNRVWFDADQDGIQDADEPAVAGVTVNLIQSGVTIGTRTTNAAGEYYFRSTDSDLGGKFLPDGGAYTVQFVKPTTGTVNLGSDTRFGTVNWSDVSFTGTAVGSNATIDSNATPNVGNAALGEYLYSAGHAGENDATIDAGFVANGTLRVVKAIDPSGGASDVGATYPMTVSAVDFRGGTLSLGANASFSIAVGTAAARDISLPVGALATVNEAADARVRTFSVSPSGATLISGTGAARTVVTVTNTLYAPGTFTVAKTVTGSGSSLVAANASFTVEYNYAALGSTWKSLVVQRNGAAVASDPIPYGTVVTLREVAPTVPTNVTWGTPKWTISSVTTTAATRTLTIGDGTVIAVGLENPNTVITGGFTITKVVSGPAAPSVPTAFTFPVTYSYVDLAGVTQSTTVNLTKSGATQTATVTNVPVGTVVTLSEGARGNAAPDVAWGTPIWSNNVTTNPDGTATFTVGSTGVSVVLDNPTTRVLTSLTLTKSVTGPAASSVPGALTYTVNYNYTDFAGLHSFTTTVSKDSPTVTLDNIPLGVTVNLAEVAPTGAPASVAWSTAKWTSTGATVTDHGDGSASIVVSTASAITLGLENPTTLVLGGFTVTKSVTGNAAASVPGAYTFTLTYTYPGQATPQTLTVSKNSPTATVTGLPVGTVVTIIETAPTGAPADVSWGTPIWSANATTNADHSATFTVGSSPIALTIENPTVRKFASLDLTKTVTGSAAASVPGAFAFTVTYSYTDVAGLHTQTATVSKDAPTVSLANIPVGSVVTFTEAARTGAPADVAWQTPVWSASGASMVDNGDGSGTLTISGTGSISVGLENPTTTVTGGFTFSKSVSGPGAASVPNGFAFTVTYTYPGQATPQTLTVTKASPNASVSGLPVGTVVTISENARGTAAPDVAWGTPTWSNNVTTNPDGSATFTIGTSPVAVLLDNPTTRLFGSIQLTKSVTGAAAAAVPNNFAFTINYSYTDVAGPHAGSVTLSKNAPTASITTIPVGSNVTFAEVAPTGAPGVVAWQTPVWTATGGTITDNGDGTASLTVSGTTSVAIGLENPTTQILSGFSIQKSVSGAVSTSVPDDFEFTLTYTYAGQASPQTLTVSKDSPIASVSGLPVGTVVTVSEATPSSPAVNVAWGTPTWSGNTTTNPDGSATFTVGTSNLAVLLDNPTIEQFGSFSITKSVTGPSVADVDVNRSYTGTYSYAGQTSSGVFTLKAGETWTLPVTEQIPAGTVVTISEIQPTGGLPALEGWGTPILSIGGVPFGTGATGDITIGINTVVDVDLENPTTIAPHVSILKGDGTGTTIVHEADTMPEAEYYAPGETRTIVFRVTNDGPEPLRNVTVTDTTMSGSAVQAITWTFPDGSTAIATYASGVWSADWSDTFGGGTSAWAPGDVITGTAQLTVAGTDSVHVDRARVDAVGQLSGIPVTAKNDYNAYSASIQIIHYDGNRPDPVVKDTLGDWIIPTNPLPDIGQDANDTSTAVKYAPGAPQRVRWVITNIGTTYLTHLTMSQTSATGPQYSDFTFDMTPIGGTQTAYNFATDGPWEGIFPPGASFFGTGPLILNAFDVHEDTTKVVGAVVIPDTDSDGMPTDLPTLALGLGVVFTLPDGSPRIVQDSDPFHAVAKSALASTGLHSETISLLIWLGVGGTILGLVLMLLPRRRRRGVHVAAR